MIEQKKKVIFSSDKRIAEIENNQGYLRMAVEKLKEKTSSFVLDGHFCVLDKEGNITRIPKETFEKLKPDAIVLLVEKAEIIAERRKKRDGIKVEIDQTNRFQDAEIIYAREIAEKLDIPLRISCGAGDIQATIAFIKEQG